MKPFLLSSRRTAARLAAAVLLFVGQSFLPLDLGSAPASSQGEPPVPDTTVSAPPQEFYVLTPVIAEGMNSDSRKDLTRDFLEEASVKLANRIAERDTDYLAIHDCGANPAIPSCEVISVEIKQGAGAFSYEIKSKLLNTTGPTRHPVIAGTRTCSINIGEVGSDAFRSCHRTFLQWYAKRLVVHDEVYHGVNQ